MMAYNELHLFHPFNKFYVHLPFSVILLKYTFVLRLLLHSFCHLFTFSSEESVRLSRISSDGSGGEPGNGGIPVTRPPPYQDMDVSAP